MPNIHHIMLLLFALLFLAPPPGALAQNTLKVDDRGVFVAFPDRLTFNAQVRSNVPITQVVLEYGVEKRSCGTIVAKAFPKIPNATSFDINWTWDMGLSGSEPPGSVIWYRWRVTDRDGNSAVSTEQRVTWLDRSNSWKSISHGDLTLHWYSGSEAFAQELLDTAVAATERLSQMTGVTPQSPIQIYIYANTATMRDAILYEPSWTGGIAFPANNITMIGIHPSRIEWGKRTIAHELTHLLVGQLTFSCGSNVPTWLDEGIAVYGEGGLDRQSEAALQLAVASNQLLSVRSLSNGFSEHPDVADLSYSQSYSLVNYMITSRGKEPLLALFGAMRNGLSIEQGLQQTYGFGLDQLEDGWRAWVGAPPRAGAGLAPTSTAQPTTVPTYQPLAAPPAGPPHAAPAPAAATATAPATTPSAPTAAPDMTAALPTAVAGGVAAVTPVAAPRPLFDLRLMGAAIGFCIGVVLIVISARKLFWSS